jgi:putative oxidoreductase
MLKKILSPLADRSYALLRIVSGLLFAFHGVQKVFGLWSPMGKASLTSQAGIGGVIELVTGVLIAIGFFTRCAAFLASGTMAVAYFQFHSSFDGAKVLPGVNGGELAALYAWLFLFIACRGPGPWSVDSCRSGEGVTSPR